MSSILLLPAAAVVTAVGAMTLSLRRVAAEAASLRRSLRLNTATAVSVDELERATGRLHSKADDVRLRAPRAGGGVRPTQPRDQPLDR